VYAPNQLLAQRGMNRTMPGQTVLSCKGRSPNSHIEMTFPTSGCTGMACVAGTVIHNLQVNGRKGSGQFVVNFLRDTHNFYLQPLQSDGG
jgi:hypothetical protein